MYFFEMKTAFCGEMLNLNTYNQPGVEGGKDATYALLGKKGYDSVRTKMNSAAQKSEDYIC